MRLKAFFITKFSSYVIKGLDHVDKFLKLIHFLSMSCLMSVKVSKTGEISLKKRIFLRIKTVRVKNYNAISESLSPEH